MKAANVRLIVDWLLLSPTISSIEAVALRFVLKILKRVLAKLVQDQKYTTYNS